MLHMRAVKSLKIHYTVTWNCEMSNSRVSFIVIRNFMVKFGSFDVKWQFKTLNLIVMTLHSVAYRQVTLVITIKTNSVVTWNYQMQNSCAL